jgi:hypothetical protein
METNKEGWEEELYRLASLVGTDARNPKGKLKEYVLSLLSTQEEKWKSVLRVYGHTGSWQCDAGTCNCDATRKTLMENYNL